GAAVQSVFDTCWCGDKKRKAITPVTRQPQLASCCLSTCYLEVKDLRSGSEWVLRLSTERFSL
ncbi:Thyroglobulin, partial [Dissostichus eleginoides]